MRRRRFLRVAGAAGVAGLAGCNGSSNDGTETDADPDEVDDGEATTEASETTVTTTETGRRSGGPVDADAVRIGVLAPAPAENPLGEGIADGARLAAQRLNDDGGVAGADVEVVVKDTREVPQTTRERYGELIRAENAHATVGVFTDESLLAILDDIAGARRPHLTVGATTPEASARVRTDYESYKYHFRPGGLNATQMGRDVIEFGSANFTDIGWERVAVLVEDYEWTETISEVYNDRLAETGVDVVLNRRYPSGTEDFNPLYNEIEAAGADAVVGAMAHTGTAALLQWAQQRRPFALGGLHIPLQLPTYYDAVQGAAANTVAHNLVTPRAEITEKTQPFVAAYRDEYDKQPIYTAHGAHDAVMQYAQAVERQGTVDGDAVVAGLEATAYTGTYGTIEFQGEDEEFPHDVVHGPDGVPGVTQQWQPTDSNAPGRGGTQAVIAPDRYATSEYQSPSWL